MRDRLIELCGNVIESCKSNLCADCEHNNIDYPNCMGVHFADYLLENGVIVPPCKVGDTVYQVTRNFISEFRVRFVEISTCGNLFLHTDLISGIVYTGEIFSESEIGKTVFLTKEETEQALKGGEE